MSRCKECYDGWHTMSDAWRPPPILMPSVIEGSYITVIMYDGQKPCSPPRDWYVDWIPRYTDTVGNQYMTVYDPERTYAPPREWQKE